MFAAGDGERGDFAFGDADGLLFEFEGFQRLELCPDGFEHGPGAGAEAGHVLGEMLLRSEGCPGSAGSCETVPDSFVTHVGGALDGFEAAHGIAF